MHAVQILFLIFVFSASSVLVPARASAALRSQVAAKQPSGAAGKTDAQPVAAEFDRLRQEGNDALYNLDYQAARDLYLRMTKLAPGHPAGHIYLANNLWLETLNSSRRLSSSLYSSTSFYSQDKEQDEVNQRREKEFNELLKQALAITKNRLQTDPQDIEALYYQAATYGLRAGYSVTVKRSFRKAIGDANSSINLQKKVIKLDPNYTDAYLSIGLYEYVIDSLPFFWRTLARFAGLKGSKKKGIEHLELVAERGKYTSDDARVLLIGIYSREQQPESALEMISYLAKKYPRNYLFGVERAAMLYRMGRQDEGARAFGDLLKDETIARVGVDLVNYQWGQALAASGNHAAAIERYNEVARWPRSDPGLVTLAHLQAGQSFDVLGKRKEAMAEYQIVLKRDNIFDSRKQAAEYANKPYIPNKG